MARSLKEISFHKNGIIASITPYYPDQFDQWNTGKGNYLTFDSLGYLIKGSPGTQTTIDYQNNGRKIWSLENFVLQIHMRMDYLKMNVGTWI